MASFVFTLDITNKKGLHARAASSFVKVADQFQSEIFVEKDGQRVSGHSIMGLMMLAAAQGTSIKVFIEGDDADSAKEAISELVNHKFFEEN